MRTTTDPALAAYLRRLGYDEPPPPTLEHLRALHRAQLDRIPYENLGIQLGEPPPVDPAATVDRIAAVGRAGYCFHQNGALGLLLDSLGYDVTRRRADAWLRGVEPVGELNHLVLVAHGLPTDANPGGAWWVDAGLGDGFADPLPLIEGEHDDAGFRYRIEGLDAELAAWTFRNFPESGLGGALIGSPAPTADEIAATHHQLSTSPDSSFVKLFKTLRRDATGVDVVRGCMLYRIEPGRETADELTSYADWRAALTDAVGLPLDDVDDDALRALWERTRAKHEAWTAAGRS